MYLQDTALIINGEEVWRGVNVTPGPKVLNANLDELGNEVNTLAGMVSTLETNKQDKFVTKSPLLLGNDDKYNMQFTSDPIVGDGNTFVGNQSAIASFTPSVDLNTAASWEYRIKLKFNGWGSNMQGLTSNTLSKMVYCLNFVAKGKKVEFYHSSNGTSWENTPSKSNVPLTEGNIYYFRYGFTGTQYFWGYNQTGFDGAFDLSQYVRDSKKVVSSSATVELNSSVQPLLATLYLDDCSLVVNGNTVWTATNPETQMKLSVAPATTSSLGVVQPDGTTITVNEAGVISASGAGGASIDDTAPSEATTYSSNKVEDLLMDYVPASTYQELVARVAALEAAQSS